MYAILTFHSIDDSGSVLSYSPALFSKLLHALNKKNIPVLDLDTLLSPGVTRGVALTFDDGMRSVYTNALPVLAEFAAPAHIYLTTELVGRNELWPDSAEFGQFEMMNWHELEQLQAAGLIIDAHTCSHPDMRLLCRDLLTQECERSNEIIQKMTGRVPQYFAYPFGFHNTTAREVAGAHYKASVTTELGYLNSQSDSAALPRLDSYYLQSGWALNAVATIPGRAYIKARSTLRNLAGTQCHANSP